MTELRVPYRSEDDDVTSIADAARETLTGEERRVTEQLAFDALARGTTKVGDLFEELESAGRQLLDRAREGCGMLSVEAEAAHTEFERANANASLRPGRDAKGRLLQRCAEPDCGRFPIGPEGFPAPVSDRKWWCDAHRHLAEPGDDQPPEAEYQLDPMTFTVRAVGAERERLLEEDRERESKAAEREQRRREEAKALAEVRDRYADQAKPIHLAGWLVRPDGRIADDR
jgi:hypothetical protein